MQRGRGLFLGVSVALFCIFLLMVPAQAEPSLAVTIFSPETPVQPGGSFFIQIGLTATDATFTDALLVPTFSDLVQMTSVRISGSWTVQYSLQSGVLMRARNITPCSSVTVTQ